MSSEHENLDQDMADDLPGAVMEFGESIEDDEPGLAGKADITARARLEALKEKRALRKAIYDDLYFFDDQDEG